jgi:hypothetical protein
VLNDLSTGLLVGPYHLAEILGVQLRGEGCGVHEITKHHRELTAFGVRGMQEHRG